MAGGTGQLTERNKFRLGMALEFEVFVVLKSAGSSLPYHPLMNSQRKTTQKELHCLLIILRLNLHETCLKL